MKGSRCGRAEISGAGCAGYGARPQLEKTEIVIPKRKSARMRSDYVAASNLPTIRSTLNPELEPETNRPIHSNARFADEHLVCHAPENPGDCFQMFVVPLVRNANLICSR